MDNYASHTTQSKNPLKRWIHQKRFQDSIRLINLEGVNSFLDYGCGNGELSLLLAQKHPELQITAYDPAEDLFVQAKERLKNFDHATVINQLAREKRYDGIACLETIEHLPEKELNALFASIQDRLSKKGVCLFTFPIEHGLISLVKNTYRILGRRDKYASLGRSLRSLLGLSVPREPQEKLSDCNYIYSHIGFNARTMIQTLGEHFHIKKVKVMPFGFLRFGLGNGVAVIVGNQPKNYR